MAKPAPQHPTPSRPSRAFLPGTAALVVALGASAALSASQAASLALPGCGPRSACAQAAASAFGRVPLVGWPVSYVGCAWFAGLLAAWWVSRGALGTQLGWIARAGAVASVFLLGVLAAKELACPYCIAVHAGNLGFVLLAGVLPSREVRSWPLPIALGTAACVGAILAVVHASLVRGARESAERDLAASVNAVVAQGAGADASSGFTGRHRRGPADAVARIVVFTDYQCEDCARLERDLEPLLAASADVSLAIRHFPLCSACNPHAPNMHPNACWAARAAEAAASVSGDEGFWRMHRWLFARGGGFTDAELHAGLAELGFDRARFLAAMHGEAGLAAVRADVAEGMRLGLTQTPLVFVNGVELRGWQAPGALARTVAELRARGATAPHADRPPEARERFLAAWRDAPREALPPDPAPHALGPADARVRVVLFGDYLEPFTCAADLSLRETALRRGDVRYEFRHFPVNPDCNPAAETKLHPLACLAALAAEAFAVLQGEDGFWTMHDWLVTHREGFDHAALEAGAQGLGVGREALWDALLKPELPARIAEDALAAKQLGLTSIPLIFVNGKRVDRWKAGDEDLLPAIVAEAAR
jgi:protein-disulfide isomerase